MVKKYLEQIIGEILYADNNELNFLKWLILYQYKGYSEDEFKKKMLRSLQNCNLISEENVSLLTDDECADIISAHVTNRISKDIQSHNATDYAILLYIYVSSEIFSSASPIPASETGEFHFSEMIKELSPLPVPEGEVVDMENYCLYNGVDYSMQKLHFVDRVVLFFYLLLADISTISQYDLKIDGIKKDKDTICVKNLDEIMEKCKKLPSRYGYFFTKEVSSTHNKMENIVKKYLENFPEAAIPFAPSFLTIIFNSLKPNSVKKMCDSQYELFPYEDLMFPLNAEASFLSDSQLEFWEVSIFLKMLLLPVVWQYTKVTQDMEKRFNKELSMAFKKWKKANSLEEKDFTGKGKIDKMDFFLHALVEHDFCFSNSYFNIFLYICKNKELFVSEKGNSVDIPLSILHLNAVTKWHDALLLMQGMPFLFRKFKFFYLKMLSVYPDFQKSVYIAANVSETFFEINMRQDMIILRV